MRFELDPAKNEKKIRPVASEAMALARAADAHRVLHDRTVVGRFRLPGRIGGGKS